MNIFQILGAIAFLCIGILGSYASESFSPVKGEEIDFQRDIRPLLSANCFLCHGPDEGTREADLRLDIAESAYEDRGGYAAIVPGDPVESELLRRMISEDPDERMPPEGSGKTLSEEQIQLFRRWINSGARYEQHWAFVPPERPALPRVERKDWVENEIDLFVLEKLEQEGLSPSTEADRYQLVRRVYLDLIGLPPTVQQADAFVADDRPEAYEELVDQLLASPHYGERWARRWLDLARYSDTKGYEKDQPRSMWPYRDWVINALNDDMPFDQFTIEQIAGDMLPNPSSDQLVASGFHRNTMTNEEGGIDPQEFRFQSIVDRVATTGSTWLGLTLGCAQCHTHKYDPITHAEYYQIFAFLNNANELKLDLPDPAIEAARKKIDDQIQSIVASYPESYPLELDSTGIAENPSTDRDALRRKALEKDFSVWKQQQRQRVVPWTPLPPLQVESNLPSVDILEDHSVLTSGDVTKNDTFTITLDVGTQPVTAIRLEALPDASLPNGGPGRQQVIGDDGSGEGNFFLSEITAWVTDRNDSTVEGSTPLKWQSASAGYVPEGLSAEHAIDGRHDTGWTIHGRETERHTAVFCFAEPVSLDKDQRLTLRLQHENFYPAGLGRFRLSVTSQALPVAATSFPEEIASAFHTPEASLTDPQQNLLRNYFFETTPSLKAEHQRIEALEKTKPTYPTALVMRERESRHRRKTFIHHRGEFLQLEKEVDPEVLEVLHDMPEDMPKNRLSFAKWLVASDNPLVARVVMNRQWEAIFGRGIVRTTADFGYQGEFPTHPKLLDWLAVEFMECGWSLKEMHRQIVSSATYRQTSQATDEMIRRDPENKLLARGARVRLEAELLRDSVLQASGLLNNKVGGPSVFPPQPPGITEAAYGPLEWKTSRGQDRYRRGLYTFSKRTAPYAAFGLFDAPSGEVCIPRRDRSNTPLQSLAMLNDKVTMEAARHMAGEAAMLHGDDRAKIAVELFRRCVIRPPSTKELSSVVAFFENQLERFQTGESDPLQVLNTGPVVEWSFSQSSEGWTARNQCTLEVSDKTLTIHSEGEDPFIGVDVAAPLGAYTLKINALFENDGRGEIFWTTASQPVESADRSSSFEIVSNAWHEYVVPLTIDGELRTLRLDAGQSVGKTLIDQIRLAYGDDLYRLPSSVDRDQLAAWLLTARALLNLDETIWKP